MASETSSDPFRPRIAAPLPEKLPAGATRVLKALKVLGWEPLLKAATEHHEAVLWASDSDEHAAGETRSEAKDLPVLQVAARYPGDEMQLGFVAEWVDKKFGWAHVSDPVGLPVELWANYTIDDRYRGPLGLSKAQAKELADERSAEYNTGESYLSHDLYIKKVKEFEAWLSDWTTMLLKKENRNDD